MNLTQLFPSLITIKAIDRTMYTAFYNKIVTAPIGKICWIRYIRKVDEEQEQ